MAKKHHPRRGSLQFWPRKRSKRSFARIRSWREQNGDGLQAFVGYKVGMTHVIAKDNSPHTMFKKDNIFVPVTIIECPPLKSLSLRFYQNSSDGSKLISEVFSKSLDKGIKKHIKFPKKEGKIPENFEDVRLRVYTQPRLTGIGKKKPETLEIGIGGKDVQEKLKIAQELLEKEIKLGDVLKDKKLIDIHSITKGKGFQGTVKRFGVKIRQHKSEKTKRGAGTLGAWTPKKVLFSVPQAGRMGHHQRVEYNKLSLMTDSDPKKVNPKGGFLHYGLVKNDYIVLKGSVAGPAKKTIILTPAVRKGNAGSLEILSIDLESKQ
ncbi:MAG: 50S ribosomal protein L3 [Candidatus Woesearchaeota archaeon]